MPDLSGAYYLIIHDYDCYSEKSNVINYWHTGTNKKTLDYNVFVYPNPARSQITVSLPQNYNRGELTLVDVNAKEILTQKFKGNRAQINISNLPDGIYFLQISYDNQLITKKIIKK